MLLIQLFFSPYLAAQSISEDRDSLILKNNIKLDLAPLYYDIFDNRIQIRLGFEYERILNNVSCLSLYTDVGLYDSYDYTKHYNFFNEAGGMYSINEKVSIIGIHQLPAYNYYLLYFKKKRPGGLFSAAALDLSYYQKLISTTDTQSDFKYNANYYQLKLGMGIGFGVKYFLSRRILTEIKTSFFTKIFNVVQGNPMLSLDAQWTSPNYRYWWISNFKLGYAF